MSVTLATRVKQHRLVGWDNNGLNVGIWAGSTSFRRPWALENWVEHHTVAHWDSSWWKYHFTLVCKQTISPFSCLIPFLKGSLDVIESAQHFHYNSFQYVHLCDPIPWWEITQEGRKPELFGQATRRSGRFFVFILMFFFFLICKNISWKVFIRSARSIN